MLEEVWPPSSRVGEEVAHRAGRPRQEQVVCTEGLNAGATEHERCAWGRAIVLVAGVSDPALLDP